MARQVCWIRDVDPPDSFPNVADALREPDGLLAAGGDLSTERLIYAYRHGIFPWYEDGQPLLWWSPDPRCVFRPGDFHISRRLQRTMRRSKAEIRCNCAFAEVIRACAGQRRHQQGTWITADMMRAYQRLHDLGWAHSIEVWQHDELVGGLYGVAIGRVFFGESMWSGADHASKFALAYLAGILANGDFELLDCQVVSQHLQSLGARCESRHDFTTTLQQACEPPCRFENWPDVPISVAQLATD